MQHDMQYKTALAALRVMADLEYVDIPDDEREFLMAAVPWLANQRNRAKNVILSVCNGSLDIVGMPRFELPAEFVAAAIQKFVHPINWGVAASVIAGVEDTESIIWDKGNSLAPDRIFAMVLRIEAGNEVTAGKNASLNKRSKAVSA